MVTFAPPCNVRRTPVDMTATPTPSSPVRTSETHPMNVSWVAKSSSGGRFGLTFCPGKTVCRRGVRWSRNLEMDLDRLKTNFGVTTILCLLSQAELASLKLRNYEQGVRSKGIQFLSFPIVEMAAPDSLKKAAAFIELLQSKSFSSFAPTHVWSTMCDRLSNGEVMIIHCRGGVGRAGLIASCLLLKLKMATSPTDAISKVRKLRCRSAVESYCQEQFISKYANFITTRAPSPHVLRNTEWELFQKKTISKNKYLLGNGTAIAQSLA